MKNYFLLLTLLCLSLSARAHDAEVDGIFYNLDAANKTATVTFKGEYYWDDNEYSGDVEIPETVTYNGITYSVTSLGIHCFYECSSLTSITIPNSVTSLGDYCFKYCSSLTAITIGNSVTSLGYACFEGCSSLTSITIPKSVTSLGDYCFKYCSSLTSITIPNSVTSVGSFCFSDCSSLERMVVDAANPVYDSREDCNAIILTSTNELIAGCKNSQIPNSVTSLGAWCFDGCSSLTSITIPNSVTSLGESCFFWCYSLTSITIGNSVTSLGESCFYGCSSLTAITIPNSVTSLGSYCFEGCRSLTSITIGNSVTSLGTNCFNGCSSLERMVVDAANPVYDSRGDCNAIILTSTNELVAGCKNSQIPNSVTSLGTNCFNGCSSLTSITIPNSVTSLGRSCFGWCSSLTSITIPNSVTSLGSNCFDGCYRLTSIYMLPSTPPITVGSIFDNTPLEIVYVVDEDAKTAYQAQAPWNEYDIVVMPTGIEEVETDKTAPTIIGYYDLNGKLINGKQRGAVIVRYSDDTTRKLLVK